jgi:hypothetical protein
MSYCRTIRWATACVVLFCATLEMPVLCDGGSPKDDDWKISVTATEDGRGEWQLDVVMEYHGENAVELPYSEIPWKWPDAITVCAVLRKEFLPSPCSPTTLAVARPKGQLTVTPGEKLKGAIPLRSLFKHWDQERLEGPVIVFWSYKVQISHRVGGWIEIPQAKSRRNERDNSDSREWKVEASVKKASSEVWNLNVAIKYHGTTDTYLQRYVLPWEWPQSLILCAVPLNGDRADPFQGSITGDPPMSIMWVKPGEVIRGDIKISPLALFNYKIEVFRRWPVIVFWSYKCKSSNRVGGWFEVNETHDVGSRHHPNKRPEADIPAGNSGGKFR